MTGKEESKQTNEEPQNKHKNVAAVIEMIRGSLNFTVHSP